MYIRLNDSFYPCDEQMIREAAAPKLLPSVITEDHVAVYGFAKVKPIPKPQSLLFQYKLDGVVEINNHRQENWIIDDGGLSIEQHQQRAIRLSNAMFQEKANTLAGDYPLFEIQTWPEQQAEAYAYANWIAAGSNEADQPDTPTLDVLCSHRGDSVEELHLKVISNVNAWLPMARTLAGKRQQTERAIKTANTLDQIDSVLQSTAREL